MVRFSGFPLIKKFLRINVISAERRRTVAAARRPDSGAARKRIEAENKLTFGRFLRKSAAENSVLMMAGCDGFVGRLLRTKSLSRLGQPRQRRQPGPISG